MLRLQNKILDACGLGRVMPVVAVVGGGVWSPELIFKNLESMHYSSRLFVLDKLIPNFFSISFLLPNGPLSNYVGALQVLAKRMEVFCFNEMWNQCLSHFLQKGPLG